jgi:hypothetical protein
MVSVPKTDFSNDVYYKHLNTEIDEDIQPTKQKYITFTNGMNKRFEPNDGGTNSAITKIMGTSVFYKKSKDEIINNKIAVVFNANISMNEQLRQKLNYFYIRNNSTSSQTVNYEKIDYDVGTVFYAHNTNVETTKKEKTILRGVYHVNGYNFKYNPKDKELLFLESFTSDRTYLVLFKNYVIEYYTAILNDFINNKLQRNAVNILHLVTIPGGIYAGSDGEKIIGEYMREAILNFVKGNKTTEIVYIVADLEEMKSYSGYKDDDDDDDDV